ncbi:MAG: hypothetical protein AB1668_02090 [Nanoarchaeota archaeon]
MVKAKKVKAGKDISHHLHLGIVAIVAVVSIVILILNFVKAPAQVVTEGGEAVVGEAGRIDVSRAPLAASTVCKEGEKCGFVTKDEAQKLVLVDNNKIIGFYGKDFSWQQTTGAKICKDMGYKSCWASQAREDIVYYSSDDGSCSGAVQLSVSSDSLMPCGWPGLDLSCEPESKFFSSEAGLETKDRGFKRVIMDVIRIE